jgi:hypothetical protein|tara:strand:+ start:969 stop:2243 length:1275 start_codon:yes stop_codon:yes gene_type:complete
MAPVPSNLSTYTENDRNEWLSSNNLEVNGRSSGERDQGKRRRLAIESKYRTVAPPAAPPASPPAAPPAAQQGSGLVGAGDADFQAKWTRAFGGGRLSQGEQFDIQHNLDRMVPGTNYTYRMYMDNPAAYGGESGRPLAGPSRGRQAAPDNTALGQQALEEAQKRANERLGGAGRFERVTRPTFEETRPEFLNREGGSAIDVRPPSSPQGVGGAPPGPQGVGGAPPGPQGNGTNGTTGTTGTTGVASDMLDFANQLALDATAQREQDAFQFGAQEQRFERQQLIDEAKANVAAMTALREPGVGLVSMFTQRRPPGAQVPLPPELGALLRGQTVPAAGIIGGDTTFMDPDQLTAEVFRDAMRNVTAKNYAALQADPTALANVISFGNLAGADPLRALQNIRATLPSARDVQGSILDTQYRDPSRVL